MRSKRTRVMQPGGTTTHQEYIGAINGNDYLATEAEYEGWGQ